ncbi:MAG: molecular chaperone DnaJ [Chloroflexi bacterium]|nr:molecular chaperone DnaJ [Chloroflexota bacterium]
MSSEGRRDYYETLGVSRDASKDDLRSAYRKLARRYHPDVNKEPDAEDRFKEINEAYQVLNDDKLRAQYDRFGHAGLEGQGGAGGFGFGFGGFEDIFEDLFGFGTSRAARQGPRRGADLRYDLEIAFEQAVFGVEREIEITRLETCDHCAGSGAEPGTSPIRCSECNGTGQVRRTQQSVFGSFVNVATCPRCQGTGEVVTSPCSVCHGSRRSQQTRRLSVDIPAGVDDGMRIRLAGEGEHGLFGGPPGNLYVMLHVAPHKFFTRRDQDVLLNVNINIAQAALGDEITVPTLDGDEKLLVPGGTQAGSVLRMRGKGVPRLNGHGRGEQIVILNVVIPTDLTVEQRDLLKQLGKTLGSEVAPQAGRGFLDRVREALGI